MPLQKDRPLQEMRLSLRHSAGAFQHIFEIFAGFFLYSHRIRPRIPRQPLFPDSETYP